MKIFFRSIYPSYDGFPFDEGEMRTIEQLPDKEALIYSNE